MAGKLSFDALAALEKKYALWEYRLFDYPLWIHCREPLLEDGIMADRKMTYPAVLSMLKSFFQTVKFLLSQNQYDTVYFLMERAEILQIYKQENSKRKILFLNREQERAYEEKDYISSDFFNLLRFISRKTAYLIYRKKYRLVMQQLDRIGYGDMLDSYIRTAMGDAFFLKILSFLLRKGTKKFYSGCVIPIGEKFVNRLNSYEVQHGVIYPEHIGYAEIPEVRNTLVLYSERYRGILQQSGYRGKLLVHDFKKSFFERESSRHFPIVIYTQPLRQMQEGINQFLKKYQPKDVYIQKHPKDYFDYDIASRFLVTATTPHEVSCPIVYTSSIVENFALYDRKCYIYDVAHAEFDLMAFLKIYTEGSKAELIVRKSLDEIYDEIKKEILFSK